MGFEIGERGREVMDYTVDVDLVYTSFFAKVFAIGFFVFGGESDESELLLRKPEFFCSENYLLIVYIESVG